MLFFLLEGLGQARCACDWLSVIITYKSETLWGGGRGNREDSVRRETPNNEPTSPRDEFIQPLRFRHEMREGPKKKQPPHPKKTLWTAPAKTGKFSFVSIWPFARVFIVDS